MILAVCPNPSVDTFVWVESLEPGKVHRVIREKRFPGGKGVHVALAVAELGEEVTLLGFWGGETGSWIKNECSKKNIKCVGPGLNEWTRSCITFKSEGIYDDTELLGTGPEITKENYREFVNTFKQSAGSAEVITLSGSWPAGAPDEGYAELIKLSGEAGIPVILDATGESFKLGLEEHPTAVHLNLSESRAFTGLKEIRDIIEFLKVKADLVAVTSGKEGLFLGRDEKILQGRVFLPNIYSTVGSGDCLTAGLAVALKKKMIFEDMLRLGVACGGANCLREDLGMFYDKDVKKLISEVEITAYK